MFSKSTHNRENTVSFSLGFGAAVMPALFRWGEALAQSFRLWLWLFGKTADDVRRSSEDPAFRLDNEGELSDPEKPLRRAAAPLSRGVKRPRLFWPCRLPEGSPLTDTLWSQTNHFFFTSAKLLLWSTTNKISKGLRTRVLKSVEFDWNEQQCAIKCRKLESVDSSVFLSATLNSANAGARLSDTGGGNHTRSDMIVSALHRNYSCHRWRVGEGWLRPIA